MTEESITQHITYHALTERRVEIARSRQCMFLFLFSLFIAKVGRLERRTVGTTAVHDPQEPQETPWEGIIPMTLQKNTSEVKQFFDIKKVFDIKKMRLSDKNNNNKLL